MKKYWIFPVIVALAGCSKPEAQSQTQTQTDEPVKTEQAEKPATEEAYKLDREDLGSGLYMLSGRGGNIGLSVGNDGAFVIDDQ